MNVTMADLDGSSASDPDAQATVTDFLDYTEYLPSDILRSLTLIRGLDETYNINSYQVHDLTRQYGSLPTLPLSERPDPQQLRLRISTYLDTALNARESSYAEACRLFDVADRHYTRLNSIINKLHALPKPPSRDPTPVKSLSPDVKRSRSGRKIENGPSAQRLTLNPPRAPIALLSRPRGGHRITVPGEVLPAWNPDSPLPSTEVSGSESEEPSPVRPLLKLKAAKPLHKILPEVLPLPPKREKRELSVPYRKPTPPPDEAELGGKFRPWIRLTEWEMYKLRKKMKKNHTWDPSDIMIQRTLESKGRGWDNYYAAKTEAQKNGTPFIDVDNIDRGVGKVASTPLATPTEEKTLTLKKTDSRKPKPKQDAQAQTQATIAAREAEQAARRLGDIGSAFKNLFSPFSNALASLNRGVASSPTTNGGTTASKKPAPKPTKKRKIEDIEVPVPLPSPSIDTPESSQPKNKRQKTMPVQSPVPTTELASTPIPASESIKVPTGIKLNLTLPAAGPSTTTTRASSVRQASLAPKTETTPAPSSRPPSRRSAVASVEPESTSVTRSSRRTSTPATRHTPAVEISPKSTAASRRSRREAPGTVTQSSQDGGAAVSISKRKTKPGKQAKMATPKKEATGVTIASDVEIRVDVDGKQEFLNPDEERYCICGDVSWGEMICCELDEKCEHGQWFHMECVQLPELPPRTVKWYCPGDRKKLKKGENTNGLVGRGIR